MDDKFLFPPPQAQTMGDIPIDFVYIEICAFKILKYYPTPMILCCRHWHPHINSYFASHVLWIMASRVLAAFAILPALA